MDSHSPLPSLVLIGQWDESNENDKAVVSDLAIRTYEETAREATALARNEDSPLTQIGSRWRFLCHEEAWHLLAPCLTTADVERFQEKAISLLGTESPKFEMAIDERYLASIRGKTLPHSELLRQGIARTLDLMGSQGERAQTVPNVSHVPEHILQRVFAENAGWKI